MNKIFTSALPIYSFALIAHAAVAAPRAQCELSLFEVNRGEKLLLSSATEQVTVTIDQVDSVNNDSVSGEAKVRFKRDDGTGAPSGILSRSGAKLRVMLYNAGTNQASANVILTPVAYASTSANARAKDVAVLDARVALSLAASQTLPELSYRHPAFPTKYVDLAQVIRENKLRDGDILQLGASCVYEP